MMQNEPIGKKKRLGPPTNTCNYEGRGVFKKAHLSSIQMSEVLYVLHYVESPSNNAYAFTWKYLHPNDPKCMIFRYSNWM